MAKMKAFNTGKFAEKVTALATYDSTLITKLYQDPINKRKINRGAAFILKNYFNEYMDSRSKQSPSQYHHVYEFDRVGQASARLFSAAVLDAETGSILQYSFTPAKEPNRNGYPFPDKANVMESGQTVVIRPRQSRYLKYQLKDGRFVTSEMSVVRNPGGPEVEGSFSKTFNQFMVSKAMSVLEKFNFYRNIERTLITKRRIMVPRINSGMVADAVAKGRSDADQIANGVSSYYV